MRMHLMNEGLKEIKKASLEIILEMVEISKKILKGQDLINYFYVLINDLYPTIILYFNNINYENLTEKIIDEHILKLFQIIPNTIMNSFRQLSDKFMDIANLNIEYFIDINHTDFVVPEKIPDEIYMRTLLFQRMKNAVLKSLQAYKEMK